MKKKVFGIITAFSMIASVIPHVFAAEIVSENEFNEFINAADAIRTADWKALVESSAIPGDTATIFGYEWVFGTSGCYITDDGGLKIKCTSGNDVKKWASMDMAENGFANDGKYTITFDYSLEDVSGTPEFSTQFNDLWFTDVFPKGNAAKTVGSILGYKNWATYRTIHTNSDGSYRGKQALVWDCAAGTLEGFNEYGYNKVTADEYKGAGSLKFLTIGNISATVYNLKIEPYTSDPVEYEIDDDVLSVTKWQLTDGSGTAVSSPVGLTSIGVDLEFEIGRNVSENASIYAAVYSDSGALKAVSGVDTVLNYASCDAHIDLELDSAVEESDSIRVYVWDSEQGITPLTSGIDISKKISLESINDGISIQNDAVIGYLNDSYSDIAKYDNDAQNDIPKPVAFRWAALDSSGSSFTLYLSENADMTDAAQYITNEHHYYVYNLKVGTRYYWQVSADDGNGGRITSDISTFITAEDAPRMIFATGATNARDIGGWRIGETNRVKQGMVYRSAAFDGSNSLLLNQTGIDVLCNDLGIKTEIDLRSENKNTSSVLGNDINYIACGMNYDGDYLSNNKAAIKTAFEALADSGNYPVIIHCQAGADRTGALIYLLNGLLGVSKEDLIRDYLLTNFAFDSGTTRTVGGISNKYVKTIDEYQGSTLSEKIYNYLNTETGVSTATLNAIIANLTE